MRMRMQMQGQGILHENTRMRPVSGTAVVANLVCSKRRIAAMKKGTNQRTMERKSELLVLEVQKGPCGRAAARKCKF